MAVALSGRLDVDRDNDLPAPTFDMALCGGGGGAGVGERDSGREDAPAARADASMRTKRLTRLDEAPILEILRS